MTPVEISALDFIRDRIAATGCAPTLTEIADRQGWSAKSNAHRLVQSLVRQGRLIREPHKARNLALPKAPLLNTVPTADLQAELARRSVDRAPGGQQAALIRALGVIEDDRAIFFDCHTVEGDPATLGGEEALVVAEYDAAISALRQVIAA